ncbi:glypican-5 isoform X2 [Sinocyclocheilus rhinocerous]|uniref:glypican-5 isoform X2 n=1 Tax=Sinocyclocheilus rhinocerous TaxID=307959 RepID=UPI0007B82388|nr:PREDICTED: glypican-5-like isoform X2 [Sinocyclocheilus rhinocerous]
MPRVNVNWIITVLAVELATLSAAHAHSCHEVKTAFQVRQIGQLKWVPETPAIDVDLSICKHAGPSCCTRRMEESYRAAVLRDTTQNIRSYSFELKYLISEHAAAFQDTFQSLITFSHNHLTSLFETTYSSLMSSISPHIVCLFTDLSRFLQGTGNVSVEAAVHCFFDSLFPLVHTRIVNPGLAGSIGEDSSDANQLGDCLRMTRQDVNPFGPHPKAMADTLASALRAGRVLSLALGVGLEVMNITDTAELSKECSRALVRMHYCSHCRGLTLIRACSGYCLNVMRGCLASLSELHNPWRQYVNVLQDLTHIVTGAHNLELALLGIRGQVEEAVLYAQLHGPRLTATVDKVCGHSSNASSTTVRTFPPTSVTPPPANSSQDVPGVDKIGMLAHLHSSLPLKTSKSDRGRTLKKVAREFTGYISRYKSFFSILPETLCEGEMGVDELTCWSGDDVVKSYTARVVGNGVRAQSQNPEVRVRGADPVLMDVKNKLELFNTEIQEIMPGVGHRESWDETGSGESSGECDDEDGCEGSGESVASPSHLQLPPSHITSVSLSCLSIPPPAAAFGSELVSAAVIDTS